MTRLSKEQLLLMHEQLIDRYGGSHGIRDEGLLDSALATPFQSFSGVDFYPTPLSKAIRLCCGLVHNHPFIDGNKRIGALALLVTLDLNHIEIKMSSRELEDVILSLAAGDMSEEIFSEWIRDHTFSIKQPRFNRETEAAIMEARDILAGRQEARRYSSTKELFDELDAEDE